MVHRQIFRDIDGLKEINPCPWRGFVDARSTLLPQFDSSIPARLRTGVIRAVVAKEAAYCKATSLAPVPRALARNVGRPIWRCIRSVAVNRV